MDLPQNDSQRLQKAMAQMGIASRRQAEKLICQGFVKVNGITVTELGTKVNLTDVIEVEGVQYKPITKEVFVYILLNKPEGVISSVTDPRQRTTVIDLIRKDIQTRIYPVGRLDYDTAGLLLLTNDGELTYRLTHPSYGVEKTYRVWIKNALSSEALQSLQNGVLLEDGLTSPAKIRTLLTDKKGNELSVVEISIHEGKNRQVRRMFDAVGYPVCALSRIAFGPLQLQDQLKPGHYRRLTKDEVISLKKIAGLPMEEWGERS